MRAKAISLGIALVFLVQVALCFGDDLPRAGSGTPGPEPPEYSEQVLASRLRLYQAGGGAVPPSKDPFIAGLLSWFMMGVGQIYAKEYTKGSLFIAAGLVDKLALVLLISHINSTYGSKEEIVYVDWQAFDSSTRALIITYLAGSLGLRTFCAIDAVQSAKKFNRRFYARDDQGFSLSLEDEVRLQYHIRFSD